MRIGVHTVNLYTLMKQGTIIGGIIGTDIIRYDVYGSDVTIANKIESYGIQGSIAISEDTKCLLE